MCIHTLHRKPHPRPLSQRCQGTKKDHTCKYKMKNRICEYNVWSSLICIYKILIAICSNKMLIYNIHIYIYIYVYIYAKGRNVRRRLTTWNPVNEINLLCSRKLCFLLLPLTGCAPSIACRLWNSREVPFSEPRVSSLDEIYLGFRSQSSSQVSCARQLAKSPKRKLTT